MTTEVRTCKYGHELKVTVCANGRLSFQCRECSRRGGRVSQRYNRQAVDRALRSGAAHWALLRAGEQS